MVIPKKYKDSVRLQLKQFFPNDLPESFVDSISKLLVDRAKSDLQSMPDYNETKFLDYLSKGTKLLLTPNGILLFVNAIHTLVGREVYDRSPKYQKAREIFDIIPALLALKKITGIEYLVYLRDDPDFEILPNAGLINYTKKEFIKYEFMYVSHFETSKWNIDNPLPELIDFIIEKKFNKAYGENVGLIFHLAITSTSLSAKALSEALTNISSKNPYASIWMIAVTSPDLNHEDIGIARLFPSYGSVSLTHEEQITLLY